MSAIILHKYNFIFIILFLNILYFVHGQEYYSIGNFSINKPAFINIDTFSPKNNELSIKSLVISSFSGLKFKKDEIHIIEDIGSYLTSISSVNPILITNKLQWPNEATAVPFNVFNQEVLGVGNGFLVPGKSTGYVSIIPSNTSNPHHMSKKKTDWFYHVTEWWDMNGDGYIDCISARATVPTNAPSQGELVWFENPGENQFSEIWNEHIISSGPDVMIHLLWIDEYSKGIQPQIIAAQFFSTEISLWWTENNNLWSNNSSIQSRIIDNTIGNVFDIQYFDLNNDGKKDILVTNHQGEANESAVFAYTIPENWKTDPWPRYVLATNITTLKRGANQASPGRAKAFYPYTNQTNTKPLIIVAGDGAEIAFILYPNSQDTNDWTYTRKDIINTGCTVGQIDVGDVNGDLYADFFIPAYEHNTVFAYTFAPNLI